MEMKNKHIEAAWSNATRRKKISSVFSAIKDAVKTIPEEIETTLDFESANEVAKRIAAPANGTIYSPTREEIESGEGRYEGEWHVTDTDLNVWSRFVMWMSRYDEQLERFVCTDITQALSNKRMQQAADRFRKTGLTSQHCALLENMRWQMDFLRGDWVSLHVQGKRTRATVAI